MSELSMAEEAARFVVAAFPADIKATRQRIRELHWLIDAARKNGGIITTNMEDLQDGRARYEVTPEVMLSFLTADMMAQSARLAVLEAKEERIAAIIKGVA